jgi:predicted Zn-dependent peptidase
LFTVFALYKPTSSADAMLKGIEEEVAKVAASGADAATLKRVKTRMLANWYNSMESFMDRADTLAKLQTLWGDANVANQIPGWIEGVTSEDIQRVARTYLTRANRTVIDRKPVAKTAAAPAPAASTAVKN